jgi:hypothetical protein
LNVVVVNYGCFNVSVSSLLRTQAIVFIAYAPVAVHFVRTAHSRKAAIGLALVVLVGVDLSLAVLANFISWVHSIIGLMGVHIVITQLPNDEKRSTWKEGSAATAQADATLACENKADRVTEREHEDIVDISTPVDLQHADAVTGNLTAPLLGSHDVVHNQNKAGDLGGIGDGTGTASSSTTGELKNREHNKPCAAPSGLFSAAQSAVANSVTSFLVVFVVFASSVSCVSIHPFAQKCTPKTARTALLHFADGLTQMQDNADGNSGTSTRLLCKGNGTWAQRCVPICDWQTKAISCNTTIAGGIGVVTGLTLRRLAAAGENASIYGTISGALGGLASLQFLDLSGCGLIGTIPPELSSLTQLKKPKQQLSQR